ncbi:radical SAM/SPASM domain-containing protein [Paraclostridium sordellii]|uniref:Radical SAM domain-containing protein n=1 Tax=Paraclostridium sordellii TaxID=1505 RepID=A0A0C7LIU1_PARSO|nr:radical SAM protein [Paeniclostridium sordellii]CEN21872.1 radical SAM domain-containing protein [[Clostridium] sordellii] [Paeniclostridium sordellii]CEP41815.1 radical SAM domain-containing protein [[Clostridium] sordellii] [Paeniclostridium sordellii]
MNKFFLNKMANILKHDGLVIIGNKFNGKWIKVPEECYEAINYSIDHKIPIYDTVDMFLDDDDKHYYKKILGKLDIIELLGDSITEEIYYGFVPIISFAITNKCNLDCDYCCKDSSIEKEEKLKLEDLKMIIDKIVELNPINLSISGGEPLIRSDFKEFIDYIKSRYNEKLILCTNATLINSKNAEYIAKNFDAVEISLDGYDEDTCSKIRGKGVFNQVMKSIEMLKNNGCDRINLSMVVGKYNYHYKTKFEELNERLGTTPIIRYFCSLGRGVENNSKYLEEGTLFFTPSDEYENYEYEQMDTGHCNAGINQVHISDKGNLYLCPNLTDDKYKICNMKDFNSISMEKLYKRDYDAFKNFDNLKENNNERCKSCSINIFCNVCPSKTDLIKNDKVAFDINCKFMKENVYQKIW